MMYGMRRAAAYLEGVNRAVIGHAMARRSGQDMGQGARPPAALGGVPIALEVLTEARPGGKAAPITPLGYKTAVRRGPPVLASLPKTDPRRRAAEMLAHSYEAVGSVRGAILAGGDPSGGDRGLPDGGASTRMKHATRLRDAYRITRASVPGQKRKMITDRLVPRVVLAPQRKGRGGQEIRAITLLIAVCVEGQTMLDVLGAHGWGRRANHRKALAQAVLEMLDDLADAWGLGRADPGQMVDAS
ncbi:hypothetical protein ACGYK5_17095 [Sulfitobacter sp. 1A16787]|uniref:hypothetical protein n=1 Tax=Sulfitobacter sp. 1A16787 TaxID=3368571 RepID=UPI003745E9E8